MRIIEITALNNGAHRNQIGSFITIPNDWAIIPENIDTPNFPFGDITLDDTQTPPVVTSWTPISIPESETPNLTPSQQRENAYNTEKVIDWDNDMLTITEASQKWQYYASEGNTEKAEQLTVLIAAAKEIIREQYPDL